MKLAKGGENQRFLRASGERRNLNWRIMRQSMRQLLRLMAQ
jgi:hypothetical protein